MGVVDDHDVAADESKQNNRGQATESEADSEVEAVGEANIDDDVISERAELNEKEEDTPNEFDALKQEPDANDKVETMAKANEADNVPDNEEKDPQETVDTNTATPDDDTVDEKPDENTVDEKPIGHDTSSTVCLKVALVPVPIASDGEHTGPSKEDLEPVFVDHFSLGAPSSSVRFRNTRILLYGETEDQFVLEERPSTVDKGDDSKAKRPLVMVRRMQTGSFGLRFLRATYTLVALLVLGFVFIFCFQVIVFLFLNLVVDAGATSGTRARVVSLFGAILSVPVFLYSMASAMAMSWCFVVDTWGGHTLYRKMMNWSTVATEWICFVIFLGIPFLTIAITLLVGVDNWWEISALVWVCSVFLFMVLFIFALVCHEIGACFDLVQLYYNANDDEDDLPRWKQWLQRTFRAILLTETQYYSGVREERYLVPGIDDIPQLGYAFSEEHIPAQTRMSLRSRLTQLQCCSSTTRMYDKLDPHKRIYTMEEVRDNVQILTSQNWSLERMWCMDPRSRTISVVEGEGSLSPLQVHSSMVCMMIGVVLVILLVVGLLVWNDVSALSVVLLVLVVFLCCLYPMLASSIHSYRMYHNMGEKKGRSKNRSDAIEPGARDEELGSKEVQVRDEARNDSSSEEATSDAPATLFQVWETIRVAQPRPWFCWTMVGLEVGLLFLLPLITLYAYGNTPVATVFLVVGIFSGLRHYFNASTILQELGPLEDIKGLLSSNPVGPGVNANGSEDDNHGASLRPYLCCDKIRKRRETEEARILRAKSSLSEIIGRVTRGRMVQNWTWVFAFFVFIAVIMFVVASTEDSFDYMVKGVVFANDFYYPPQPQLPYPTCHMTKGFSLPGSNSTALSDYAFLATLAFAGPQEAQPLLDQWFGPGEVVDEYQFVAQYRNDSGTQDHPVSYKLFSFTDSPGAGIVSIRGSEAMWDWLVDVQLWSSAALAQLVRALNPLGWIWTPILDELVLVVNSVQSKALKSISYYRYTTQFVNDLLAGYGGGQYDTLRVTGASLGGGLAIITGAQTGASTVSISGLNAMLSRRTFDPPLTEEQLNTRIFNVIPDRDPIAHIDDRAQLFQEIQCRAPQNSFLGCHSMWRSLCEISFQCGSGSRPILCWCVSKYGYPEPIQNGTTTWQDACAES